jgi:hypothetical protein
VLGWIDEYNTIRRYSTIGLLAPVDYEHVQARGQPASATPDLPDERVPIRLVNGGVGSASSSGRPPGVQPWAPWYPVASPTIRR